MTEQTVTIRPVAAGDREQWDALYHAYAVFYEVEQTEEMRDRVWSWLHDPTHQTCGLVAVAEDGRLIGITHYRPYARPLSAAMGCFLDDLFVSPQARGSGAAAALIGAVKAIAAERGWSVVRWITADNNYRARSLYDKVAARTHWITYDIRL